MDYTNKCRLCLKEIEDKENSIPLFKEEIDKKSDEDVVSMISFCVCVQIKETAILPSNICLNCFEDLKKCRDFKKKCQDSDLELTKFLQEQEVSVTEEQSGDDKSLEPLLTPEIALTEENQVQELKTSGIPSTIKHDPNIKLKEVKIWIKKLSELNGKCDIKSKEKKSDDEDTPLSDIAHTVKKEKYQCSYCEETFRREVTKQVHEKTHKVLYKCVLCYESFHTHSKLQKHRKDVHNEDPYCCSFCSKTFSNFHTWTNHLKKNHVSCLKCKSYFKSQTDLDNHACLIKSRKKGLKSSEELQNRIQYDFPTAKRSRNSPEKKKPPRKNYYQIKKQKLIEAMKPTEFVPVSSVPQERFISEDTKQRGQFPCIRCDRDFPDKGSLICHQAVAHPGQPIDNTQRPPKKSVLFCKFCLSFFRHISDMNAHICQRNAYPVNQGINPMKMTPAFRPVSMTLTESIEKTLPIPVSLYKKSFKTYSRLNNLLKEPPPPPLPPPPPPPEIIERKPVISKLLPAPSASKVFNESDNFSQDPSISRVYSSIPAPDEVIIKQEHIEEEMEETILPEPQISIKTDDTICNQYFNPNKRKKYFDETDPPESVFRVNPNILETLGIRQDMTL